MKPIRPLMVKMPKENMLVSGEMLQILKPMASKKAVKVEEVVASPRFDGWLKKVAYGFILALGVLVAVNIIMVVMR
jgi:hypothetical protein